MVIMKEPFAHCFKSGKDAGNSPKDPKKSTLKDTVAGGVTACSRQGGFLSK